MLFYKSGLTALTSVLILISCSANQDGTDSSNIVHAEPLPTADMVLSNAKIYTVDQDNSWAEAIAIKDGIIAGIGSAEDLSGMIGPATIIKDMKGKMIMPGIHDSHLHPLDAGIGKQIECSFLSNDLAEVINILKDCLETIPEGGWLRGGQWNDGLFLSTEKSPRQILDDLAPDHPVFLMDWSVHNAWVNSKALEQFGINDGTPNPSGGVIVRDESTGIATGILLDNAAYDYRRILPKYSLQERVEAMNWSMSEIARYGITTFKDAITTNESMEVYSELGKANALPLRVKTNLTWKSSWANSHEDELDLIKNRSTFDLDYLYTGFVKIMLDGIPPTYTAAMLEPYEPSEAFGENHTGKLMIEPEELALDMIGLDRGGLSVKIHAAGDRSLRVALDAIETARETNGDSGLIHEIAHAEIIHPEDIPRFSQLNVAAEMCPILWHPIPGLDWSTWLGEERGKVWPVKSLLESGALVTYGSDWPVMPTPNPWPGIEAMVTRSDPAEKEYNPDWPEQAIDLENTIRIFTVNGAITNKVGDSSGSLEVGKDADLIVLDRNIFEVDITDVGETNILLSIVGGNVVVDSGFTN